MYMKVYELLTERTSNIKHVTVKQHPDIKEKNPRLGSGYEAKVYADKTGGTVIKEMPITTDVEDSATYQYVDMVMSNQDNPFFPRIYNAKLYTHHTMGRQKLVIQMERLTDFNSEKVAHLLPQLLAQLGVDEFDVSQQSREHIQQMRSGSYPDESGGGTDEQKEREQRLRRNETLGDLGDVLYKRFNSPEGRIKLIQGTDNAQLKLALKKTHDILQKGASSPSSTMKGDLHDSNIMVRLTPHGPQLVITDPVVTFQSWD